MTENERLTINGKEITLYREVETNLYRFSKDAVDMLLEALEEREQYRAIGTVEEFKAFRSDDFTEHLLNMGYNKGLKDGYNKAIDDFAELLKEKAEQILKNPDIMADCKKCTIWKVRDIEEIAEQLKGEKNNE